MAESLQQIKKRIKTANNIAQISKAMEMIAASKIKKAQTAVEKNRLYAQRVKTVVQKLLTKHGDELTDNAFFKLKSGTDKKLVYIISPDKGLCGGLLANLFSEFISKVSKHDYVVTIGKKAQQFCIKNGFNVIASFNMGTTFPKYSEFTHVLKFIESYYVQKKICGVEVIYTNFKNRMVQQPNTAVLAPIEIDKTFVDKGIHIFEPSPKAVFDSLMPYYFEVEFYDMLMNAYASEQAARMQAMNNSKENAKDISTFLTTVYNKSRQEKITNEILDLANGLIS